MIIKIALGTTSDQKISYLQEILGDIGIEAEVIAYDVESGVSFQPMSEEEIQKGAINRAKAALNQNQEADFGMGIEVGYQLNNFGKYEMFCCSAIVDKQGFSEYCYSSHFPLPKYHDDILKQQKLLGEYVREYKQEVDEPVTNYVRELVRGRKPLIIEATRNVLLEYLESKSDLS